MDYRYKLEIELDDEKIVDDNIYELDSIYENIRQMFADEGIKELVDESHTLTFVSYGKRENDFASFGLVETTLMDSKWFRPYVKKMLWYNCEYGDDYMEDIIKEHKLCQKKYGKVK